MILLDGYEWHEGIDGMACTLYCGVDQLGSVMYTVLCLCHSHVSNSPILSL
jgi:hypothetical protein